MNRTRERLGWVAALLAGAALGLGGCAPSEEAAEEDLSELEDGKDDSLAKVKVTTSKAQYGLKDSIVVTVADNYKVTAIYLPGCNATGLQRQSGKTWTDVGPEKACFWEGLAVKVAPGKKLSDSLGPKPAGTYRAKVLYRTGCTAKQTFSQCTGKLRTVYSASFTVGPLVKTCASSASCASGEYCQLPEGACLSTTTSPMTGTCKPRPQFCYEIYKPVCGCDGQTHGNDCYAALAGASIAAQGECLQKSECENLGGHCLPLTSPTVQPTCQAGELADETLGCGAGQILGQTTTCCVPKSVCFGAWLDQNGNCRGPADGVLPLGCCGTPCGKKVCSPTQTCCEGMPLPEPTCFEDGMCPKSKREYKTDVRYLETAELEQLREALLRFRLASYRYKKGEGEDPQPRHLGFIIDDVAPSPSVEARGDRVSLYGYTSMAVAALQVQARQIEALHRELKQLRRELRARAR